MHRGRNSDRPAVSSTPPQDRRPRSVGSYLAAGGLLALFWWLAVSASLHWSQTSDELAHVTAGYAYDRYGDFRLQPENGNLPQRVHGLAPLALGARFPTDEAQWAKSNVWQLGWDFFYGLDNPTDRMLAGARAGNALFGVALGLFIFVVARRWYGDRGGLLALGFYALCPNFLAHSALATSDLAGALMLTLAPWFFWQHLEKRTVASGLLAGLFSGLALVAKFNGVLLAPIYFLLVVLDAGFRGAPGARLVRGAQNLGTAVLQVALAGVVVWAFFDFRFSARGAGTPPLDSFGWDWNTLRRLMGAKGAVIDVALQAHLLPEAWLRGLANVLAGAEGRPAFFAGEYSTQGWRSFFPILFLAKTPLAMLLALALAFFARRRSGPADDNRTRWLRLAPVVVPAVVVAGTAIASHLNIGHRHLLPAYPCLFILLGSLAQLGPRARWLPLVLLLGQATESLAIRPHYLAFFNVAAGGPARAHRLVVDSSLDWGQDLPALREWLAVHRQPGEKFYLAYFGSAWPLHYGVRPDVFLPDSSNFVRAPFVPYEPGPGLYAVSATALSGVYADLDVTPATPAPERVARQRFNRLRTYLQTRPPDDHAGYSILLYRLTAGEISAALGAPVKAP